MFFIINVPQSSSEIREDPLYLYYTIRNNKTWKRRQEESKRVLTDNLNLQYLLLIIYCKFLNSNFGQLVLRP